METPTVTITRTVIRFKQGDQVVQELAVEPFTQLTKTDLQKKLRTGEYAAYVVWLAETRGPEAVAEFVDTPPYLKLVVPPPPSSPDQRALWRSMLYSAISRVLDPEYRKSALVRYLESNKDAVISSAVKRGVPQPEAEKMYRALVNEVLGARALEEVKRYEKTDPVDYIVRLYRARAAVAT